jgi:predicted nucleic acid-binding protein
MANGFAIALRRGKLSAPFIDRCLLDLEVVLTSAIDQDTGAISLRHALSVANSFRLTAYDTAYLETARREHLPLATLDRELISAAKKAGVTLFA